MASWSELGCGKAGKSRRVELWSGELVCGRAGGVVQGLLRQCAVRCGRYGAVSNVQAMSYMVRQACLGELSSVPFCLGRYCLVRSVPLSWASVGSGTVRQARCVCAVQVSAR